MAFEIVRVEVYGGMGGPLQDAIPVYGHKKAPERAHYPISSRETNAYFIDGDGTKWLHIRNGFIAGAMYDYDTGQFERTDNGYTKLYTVVGDGFREWNTKSGDRILYPYVEVSHLAALLDKPEPPSPPTPPTPPEQRDCDGLYRVRFGIFTFNVTLEKLDRG